MDLNAEWLESDGLGGYASGTVGGARTRRYHALLLSALTPPTSRVVLVNGFEARVETPNGSWAISSQRYTPDVTFPDGVQRLVGFQRDPWPRWTFRLEDGTELEQEILLVRGAPAAVIGWTLLAPAEGVRLRVRPLLSGRDIHATHHENGSFDFSTAARDGGIVWRPYPGLPAVHSLANAEFSQEPAWYRSFQYDEERARGLDFTEDLASPGTLSWDLSAGSAHWVLAADAPGAERVLEGSDAATLARKLRTVERLRRARFATPLHRAADAYVVQRGEGRTIVAGFPWFSDWGRDTFISLRGICLAGERMGDAGSILRAWAEVVSEGMLPNFFPEGGRSPEYNSVDASLWYVVAVHEYLTELERRGGRLRVQDRKALEGAVQAILMGYSGGTRFGIRADGDGLLAAGESGVQLTWMDARVGDRVITPRVGKPVEIQALWINALHAGSALDARWGELLGRARAAFPQRFWNQERGCLYDVVDVDHLPGAVDPTLRPNQVFAVGGLPWPVLEATDPRAAQVVGVLEARLWTPMGLRSLAPGEPGYAPHYQGGVSERDGVYHQGTVWPWLAGAFVDAWLRVRGYGAAARAEARTRFLDPLLAHLEEAGLGHVSEIADAEPPHTPRGCPFQAWSLGELLRTRSLLGGSDADATGLAWGPATAAGPPPALPEVGEPGSGAR